MTSFVFNTLVLKSWFFCIARLGLCLINYLTSKQRYILYTIRTTQCPIISIQHTLIFINLQEEMLLETNRDLRRKVAVEIFYRKKLNPLRSLITFFSLSQLEESDAALTQSLWGASAAEHSQQQQQQQGMSSYQSNPPIQEAGFFKPLQGNVALQMRY